MHQTKHNQNQTRNQSPPTEQPEPQHQKQTGSMRNDHKDSWQTKTQDALNFEISHSVLSWGEGFLDILDISQKKPENKKKTHTDGKKVSISQHMAAIP